MARKTLSDRTLKSLKAAAENKHYDRWDSIVPGLGVRVSDTERKTFVLVARYPGSKNPTRRALGVYGAITLEEARTKARDWLNLIRRGVDPAIEQERQRAAELRKQENTFAAVAEDFIKAKLAKERKGKEVARDIRRVLGGVCPEDNYIDGERKGAIVGAWGKRPITDITPLEVRNLIKGFVDAGKPYQAHNLLGYARRLWNWAIGQHAYGIETSPCDRLKPKDIIGKKRARSRVLSDAELRAAWRGGEALGYPYGPLFRLLILTGQRKSEVAEALWSEFDLAKKLWVIPAERMKADAAHAVPLSDDAVALLKALPTFNSGDYLFSTTFGKSPVNGFSKGKIRLDEKMLEILHENDRKAKLPDFVIHDIRRTVRTGLSSIPGISDLVRELVIGHTKPGLHKVYDLHAFIDEKREALELWAARLRSIVNSNVSPLRRSA
jgi:integrase